MGWLHAIGHALGGVERSAGTAVSTIVRNPIAQDVEDAAFTVIPGGGLVKTALKYAGPALLGGAAEYAVDKLTGGSSTPQAAAAGLPALPGGAPAGLPAMPAAAGGGLPGVANLSPARGVHASHAPAMTLQQLQALQSQGLLIPFSQLRVAHKSPVRGYVVVHDSAGGTFAVRKDLARAWGMHVTHHRPPISVGEWHALEKSHRVVKKLRKVEKKAREIARYAGHRPAEHKSRGKKK